MRIFLILILSIFTCRSWGQAITITDVLAGDNVLSPLTGTSMVVDPATDDDESTSMKAYYPIDSTLGTEAQNTIFSTTAGHPLPRVIGNGGVVAAYAAVPFIAFKVKSTFSTPRRLFVTYKPLPANGTTYLHLIPLNFTADIYVDIPANSEQIVKVSLKEICQTQTTSNCYPDFNNFVNTAGAGGLTTTHQFFYIYSKDTVGASPTSGTNLDTSDPNSPGVFVKVRFSNLLPTIKPVLDSLNLARGDTQLTINYTTTPFTFTDGTWKTLVLKVISTITDGVNIFNAVGGGLVGPCTTDGVPGNLLSTQVCYQLYPYLLSGSLTVSNLTNDTTYLLTAAHINKFKFVSPIPTNGSGRPQEIQAFIKEQNCFFLSAGFGTRHFVLDYMRNFRDTVLLKNTLGKLFVNYYYEVAPQYTPYIYQNPLVAFLMRTLGYGLYYFLNAWMVILSAITALLTYLKFKKFL